MSIDLKQVTMQHDIQKNRKPRLANYCEKEDDGLTAQQIEQIVTNAVEKAMKGKEISCACGLSPEAQRELGHFMGVLKNMGGEGADGYAKGAEVFRENNRFIMRWRHACERTGGIILMAIVLGACGIGASIAGMGFWEWIGRGK